MITAELVQLIGTFITLLTAALAAWQTYSNRKRIETTRSQVSSHLTKQDESIKEVHVLVNQRFSDVVSRVAQLKGIMGEAGVEIPPVSSGQGEL